MSEGAGPADRPVEEFLELESELATSDGRVAGQYDRGTIAGATTLPSDDVPADYPIPIGTAEALRLDVEVPDGATVTTYMAWPEDDPSEYRLGALLDALGRATDRFADVYGDRVALTAHGDYHVIDVEGTRWLRVRESGRPLGRAYQALVGTVGVSIVGWLLASTSGGLGWAIAFLGATFLGWLGVPVALYTDASGDGWPAAHRRWVGGSLVPAVGTGVALVYLLRRRTSAGRRPFPDQWHYVVAGATGGMILAAALLTALPPYPVTSLLLTVGWIVALGGIYYDLEYVDEETSWDPTRVLWLGATAVAFIFAFFVTPLYLLLRTVETT